MNTATYMRYIATVILCISAHSHAMKPFTQAFNFQRTVRRNAIHYFWPTWTRVFVNDAQKIILAPDAQEIKNIYTQGLIGCTSATVFFKTKNQHKIALLTHYICSEQTQHAQDLKNLVQEITHEHDIDYMKLVVLRAKYDMFYSSHSDQAHDKISQEILYGLKTAVEDGAKLPLMNTMFVQYCPPPAGKVYLHTTAIVTLSNAAPSYHTTFGLIEKKTLLLE